MAIHQCRGEYFALIRVRRTIHKVWLATRNRQFAEEMEKAEAKIVRETNHKPLYVKPGNHSFWWAIYDYVWQYAAKRKPDGVKNMLEALCTPEARICMQLRRFFNGKRLGYITAADILAYQAERRFEADIFGLAVSQYTVDREVRGLFRILNWAKLRKQVREIQKRLGREYNERYELVYTRHDPPPLPKLVHRRARANENAPLPPRTAPCPLQNNPKCPVVATLINQ